MYTWNVVLLWGLQRTRGHCLVSHPTRAGMGKISGLNAMFNTQRCVHVGFSKQAWTRLYRGRRNSHHSVFLVFLTM
jgi:hypothetical protein